MGWKSHISWVYISSLKIPWKMRFSLDYMETWIAGWRRYRAGSWRRKVTSFICLSMVKGTDIAGTQIPDGESNFISRMKDDRGGRPAGICVGLMSPHCLLESQTLSLTQNQCSTPGTSEGSSVQGNRGGLVAEYALEWGWWFAWGNFLHTLPTGRKQFQLCWLSWQ